MMHPEWQGESIGKTGRMADVYAHTRSDAVRELSPPLRHMLLVLFQYAGTTYMTNDGTRYVWCNPKNSELSDATGLSERSVTRRLAALESAGVLELESDGKNRDVWVILAEQKVDTSVQVSTTPVSRFRHQKVDNGGKKVDKPGAEGRQLGQEARQTGSRIKEEQVEQVNEQGKNRDPHHRQDFDAWQYLPRLKAAYPRTTQSDRVIVTAFAQCVLRLAGERDMSEADAAEFVISAAAQHYPKLCDASKQSAGTLQFVMDLRNWLVKGKATADLDALCDSISPREPAPTTQTSVSQDALAQVRLARQRMGKAS